MESPGNITRHFLLANLGRFRKEPYISVISFITYYTRRRITSRAAATCWPVIQSTVQEDEALSSDTTIFCHQMGGEPGTASVDSSIFVIDIFHKSTARHRSSSGSIRPCGK